MQTIGTRIATIAKEQGLNQSALAKALNITPASVSTMISGKTQPSPQTIQQICDKFGYDKNWLLTGEMNPGSSNAAVSGRIKIVMAGNSLTQTSLAKALRVNQSSVSLWLSGRANPSPQSLQQIADKYGYNFDWLSTGEGEPRSAIASAPTAISPTGVEKLTATIEFLRFIRAVTEVSSPSDSLALDSTIEFLSRILDEYNVAANPK